MGSRLEVAQQVRRLVGVWGIYRTEGGEGRPAGGPGVRARMDAGRAVPAAGDCPGFLALAPPLSPVKADRLLQGREAGPPNTRCPALGLRGPAPCPEGGASASLTPEPCLWQVPWEMTVSAGAQEVGLPEKVPAASFYFFSLMFPFLGGFVIELSLLG